MIFFPLRRFVQLEREQWLPPERLAELQWQRLQRVLRHAFDRVPFYRERFRAAGLEPGSLRGPEDLRRLPLLTRADLRDPALLVAEGERTASLREQHTSGSTGERTVTYFDPESWVHGRTLTKLRARLACGVRPWHRIALIQEGGATGGGVRRWMRQVSLSVDRSLDELERELRRFEPRVLYGFPSTLQRLAERNAGALAPASIFTSGEILDAGMRKNIEAGFGAPVYDVYGCTEVKEIAWECPERAGHHVNADWLHVECVDGAIVVTSLYQLAMPLIRYEVGDTGELLDGSCPCGRSLPLMNPGLGRSVDYFRTPTGVDVAPYTMTVAIENVPGMQQYQIVQEGPDRVTVYVVGDGSFGETQREQVRAALDAALPGVRIDVATVARIPREQSGKYRVVVSRLGGDFGDGCDFGDSGDGCDFGDLGDGCDSGDSGDGGDFP